VIPKSPNAFCFRFGIILSRLNSTFLRTNWICIFFGLYLPLFACISRQSVIHLSAQTDLAAIPVKENYEKLRQRYSVTRELQFGPDPKQLEESYRLSRKNINYEVPDRKVKFTATIWDLPLLKAYLAAPHTSVSVLRTEELRQSLLSHHQNYTQIMVAVDSYVNNYFEWGDWSLRLEDQFGRIYFPVKTQESSEQDTVFPIQKEILGKETKAPGYKVHHHYGTLFFEKLNLPALSPLKLVLVAKDGLRQVEMNFRIAGGPPFAKPMVSVEEGQTTKEPEIPAVNLIDKKEIMRLHFDQGSDFFKSKKYTEAITEWKMVLELDPEHKISKEKIAKAEELIQSVKDQQIQYSEEQKKRQMQIHFLMATDYFRTGDYEGAIREWEEVLKLDPDHAVSKEKIDRAKKKLKENE